MKNTKIMAVLVILLAAALFVGAASATEQATVNTTELVTPEEPSLLPGTEYQLVTDTYDNYAIIGESILPADVKFTSLDSAKNSATTDSDGMITFTKNGYYKGQLPATTVTYMITLSGVVQKPTTGQVNFTGTNLFDGSAVATLGLTYVNNNDNSTVTGITIDDGGLPAGVTVNMSASGASNLIMNISDTGAVTLYNGTLEEDGTITYADENFNLGHGVYTFTYTVDMPAIDVAVRVDGTEPGPEPDPSAVYRTVASGADAFVFEHIVIDGTINTAGLKLTKFSEGSNPTVVNQISADKTGVFYLTESSVNGQYGTYYLASTWPGDEAPATKNVSIWYPEISLQAELTTNTATGASSGDSIDGKTVNKDTNVSFLINAPKVGPAFATISEGPAKATIWFTTPASGKTSYYGAVDFEKKNLTAAQTMVGFGPAGNDATAGTWTAQAEYTSPQAFKDYAKKSNTISFTLQSSTLTITAAKDSVVRSNPFTVTISGKSQTVYAVYLDGASTDDVNPYLQEGQNGFQSYYDDEIGGAFFKTDASGKRTIQYNTASNTEDKTYTIKVNGLAEPYTTGMTTAVLDTSDYDKVKVKVEKGAVTITASGDGSYYLGDEIKLTGTNTDSTNVFLFLTGQNLNTNGIILKDLPDKIDASKAANPVAVKTDNTWEFKWDTSEIALDTGAYTIYATSRLTNGKSSDPTDSDSIYATKGKAVKLSDSEYATVSVNLKQPFLSAVPSGTVIAQGDKLYVRGTAEGKPANLKLFIFGPNFFEPYTITVEDDGTYEKKIDIGSSVSSNQYFVVVQHPMYNGVFDAELKGSKDDNYMYFQIQNSTTGGSQQASFVVWGANKLQGSQAADALTKMIDDANIDDIYTKLTFTVAAPWIRINNPGDQAVGSKFTVKGTTNLAVGDQILVEVVSSSFTASDKTQTNTNSGVSQTTKVVAGDGADNAWSVDVDTTNWKLDQYTIKVNGIEVDVTTTADFNLVEKVVTPTPTATSAQPTTTTAPATTTATPSTPGFGAFIALAGLGAVALLVLRRN
ncbi:hypothetical protein McpSp1_09410 [Methanocorpusculaceae archaeon Sp1]|nr:hypothetical protein [Methanocorpusculaceae archaeon Sp1]